MNATTVSAGSTARCVVAFKARPLRRARILRSQRSFCTTAHKCSYNGQPSSRACSSANEVQPTSSGRLETAFAALLASGVLAGSCIAADSPEGATQAVQAAKLASDVLRPLFNIFTILYIVRIPMTWYPDIDSKKLPWLIAYVPTEPILSATRKVVPLVSGVDVSPIVWVGLISFLNEILLGPQGLLTLIQARGGV